MTKRSAVALRGIDSWRLLEARLWIGRIGESDVMSWWRTDGVRGPTARMWALGFSR
jgi:hypothetical protein